ncbi:MAG: hypothetical protein GC152_12935 [Alphaproteobacteria bacterium]|nr:hypothetical protein [Alphaproteobacteria bacterium]
MTGVDEFRRLSGPDVHELKLSPETGEQIDAIKLSAGDRFLLTGIYEVGAGAKAALSHVAVGVGRVRDWSFPAKAAVLKVDGFRWIDGSQASRAAAKPSRNIEALSDELRRRFF